MANILHTPDNVVKEIKQCIVDFISGGESSTIVYDVIIQQIQDGGLKFIGFGEKKQSFLLLQSGQC